MEVIKTAIEGVFIIEPRLFKDDRGYFFESFSQREFNEKVRKVNFVQDNESKSSYGVLRGLHFQKPPYAQSKLVRVIKGAVLDVAVDIRKGSPTFGKYVSVELTEDNHRQFFIPRGFAHGFSVLTDGTKAVESAKILTVFQTTLCLILHRLLQADLKDSVCSVMTILHMTAQA